MAATDLTTTARFKTAMNVNVSTDDTWIGQLVTRASRWVERCCNRRFVARKYNGSSGSHTTTGVTSEDYFYFDGQPGQVDKSGYGLLYLPQYPIQANSVLTFHLDILQSRDDVSTTGDVWNTTQLLEGRDYVVDRTYGSIRLLGGPFSLGVKNYRVTYAAGYDSSMPDGQSAAPWVPDDLEQLCVELAGLIYRDKRNLKSESFGDWQRTFDTAKEDPYVSDVLGAYTRHLIPFST